MTEYPEHGLPKVTEDDIFHTDIEHLLDSLHDKEEKQRFKQLLTANPLLAKKILYEAFHRSPESPDLQDRLVSFGVYVVELLEIAATREKSLSTDAAEATTESPAPSDDAGGEDLQLST